MSLGLKQLGEDPWVAITKGIQKERKQQPGSQTLPITGALQIEEGVEGLVHVSEMDWTNRNIHPSKVVQLGDR